MLFATAASLSSSSDDEFAPLSASPDDSQVSSFSGGHILDFLPETTTNYLEWKKINNNRRLHVK